MTRIRGVKPKLKQAKLLKENGMNPGDWLIKATYSDRLDCIHRITGQRKNAYFQVVRI